MNLEDWGNGYDAGSRMMLKAIETTKTLERLRAKKIIETKAKHKHKGDYCQWCYIIKQITEGTNE